MEVSVLNIKGQETGRKVTLNEAIFGIEPNDHVLYLDVLLASLVVRRVAAVPVMVISTLHCSVVVAAYSVRHLATMDSNSTRR